MLGGGECRDSWVQKGLRKWQVTDGNSPLNERCSVPSKAPGTSLLRGGRGGQKKWKSQRIRRRDGNATAVAIMNSKWLQMPTLGLHKSSPINSCAELFPNRFRERGESSLLGRHVPTGDPTVLQWVGPIRCSHREL